MTEVEKSSVFYIQNFKIEFTRTPKRFVYTEYSRYNFKITFKDRYSDIILVEINTNEKRLYEFILESYQYLMNGNSVIGDKVYFDANENGDRYIIEYCALYSDSPTDEDWSQFIIWQVNEYYGTCYQRLSFAINEFQIDDLVFAAWESLEGLDYLSMVGNDMEGYLSFRQDFEDYIDFCGNNMDYYEYLKKENKV